VTFKKKEMFKKVSKPERQLKQQQHTKICKLQRIFHLHLVIFSTPVVLVDNPNS